MMKNREIKYACWTEFPKYKIGDDGSVLSTDHNHSGISKQMKTYLDDDGYPYVVFVVSGKRYKRIIHRMVATLFVLNPENKPQVNHKNGIRNDNRFENLEWVTNQENTLHSWRVNGRKPSQKTIDNGKKLFGGTRNPKAKINEATVLSIRRLRAKGKSLKEIAERHSLSVSQISVIANHKSWKNA